MNKKNETQTKVTTETPEITATTTKTLPKISIIKTAKASKLSQGASGELTYQLGISETNQLMIQILANETGGFFSKEWVSCSAIQACLTKATKPFPATVLKSCFISKSQNNPGFLAAVLKAEGVFEVVEGKINLLTCDEAKLQQWITDSIAAAQKAKKQADSQK